MIALNEENQFGVVVSKHERGSKIVYIGFDVSTGEHWESENPIPICDRFSDIITPFDADTIRDIHTNGTDIYVIKHSMSYDQRIGEESDTYYNFSNPDSAQSKLYDLISDVMNTLPNGTNCTIYRVKYFTLEYVFISYTKDKDHCIADIMAEPDHTIVLGMRKLMD